MRTFKPKRRLVRNIFLDTSILVQDPHRKKVATKTLEDFALKGLVTLFFSHIVSEEFIEQQLDEYEIAFQDIRKNLKKLRKKHIPHEQWSTFLDSTDEKLKVATKQFGEYLRQDLNAWKHKLKAKTLDIHDVPLGPVFDSYFRGKPPFSKKRSKTDLPDAVIFSELEILAKNSDVEAIIADINLRQAASQLERVTVYSTLDDWLKARGTELDTDYKLINRQAEIAHILLTLESCDVPFEDDSKQNAFLGLNIDTWPSLPWADGGIVIQSVEGLRNVAFSSEEIEFIGAGSFLVPTKFQAEASIEYFILKSELYLLPDNGPKPSVSEWDRHYYLAEDTIELDVEGIAGFRLVLENSTDQSGVPIESIEIEMITLESVLQAAPTVSR